VKNRKIEKKGNYFLNVVINQSLPKKKKNLLPLSRRLPPAINQDQTHKLPAKNQNRTHTLPASHHPPDAVVDPTKLTITNISLSSLT